MGPPLETGSVFDAVLSVNYWRLGFLCRGSVHLGSKWTRSVCIHFARMTSNYNACPDGRRRTLTILEHRLAWLKVVTVSVQVESNFSTITVTNGLF
jgi:hypothetical protein